MMRQLFSLLSREGSAARLTTLIFHRVLPGPDELLIDEMHARRFDEICGWLARWFNVLPLDEAAERLQTGRLPARALCITFDDGYRDNHDIALPILRRHGLTATFFVATGFLDGGRMWNDTVIESIRLAANGNCDLSPIDGAGLGAYQIRSLSERRSAVDAILNHVKYLPVARRLTVVQEIAERLGVKPRTDLMMSSSQVRQMNQAGMQIGAHTVSHPIQATLDESEIRDEMLRSKVALEDILGKPVTLFAYPNGKPDRDYKHSAVRLAKELGFAAAVTTAPGVASYGADPYQLPRFTPWDQTPARFGGRLAAALLLRRSAQLATVAA